MHPYRHIYYQEPSVNPRHVNFLRALACAEMVFGCAVTAMESVVYINEGDVMHPYLSAVGVWTGISIVTAGIFALLTSLTWTSEGRTRCMAICHAVFSMMAGINTLSVFMFRCMNISVLPLSGYFAVDQDSDSDVFFLPFCSIQMLKYISIVLYIISFMILGVSIGCGIALYKSTGRVTNYSHISTEPDQPVAPIYAPVKKDTTQVITDIEATADGFYRRLQEEEDD